jgi:hypothetical protein
LVTTRRSGLMLMVPTPDWQSGQVSLGPRRELVSG